MMNQLRLKEGWSTLVFSLGMVMLTAYAMLQAELTDGLQVLMILGFFGYMAGLLLAKSSFSQRTTTFFSLAYAAFFILYTLGYYFFPEQTPWGERIFDLLNRQGTWISKAINGQTSRDAIVFVIQTSILFWILGYTAAWYTFREQKIWRVVVPSGIVLLSVVFYYYGPRPLSLYLAIYIVLAFLYVSRTYLANEQNEWSAAVVRYEKNIVYNFMLAGLVVSLTSMLVAFSAPTPGASTAVNNALGGANTPLRRFQDNWTRLFSSLRSYGSATSDSFSESLPLGGPRNVGDTLVMDVFVPDRMPYTYWYAVVFENYDDGEWSIVGGDREVHIPDDGGLNIPSTRSRTTITQTVRTYLPSSGNIYGMADLVSSDRQMFVTSQRDNQGNKLVSSVQSRYVLPQGTVYNVQSRYSAATATQLRSAGGQYPNWISPYLQVPDSITQRTLDMADELTQEFDNPYDQAVAVQDFLREHITYNDQIEAPPVGAEPIDYVLFEEPEGYCNYYASAMAIMLRSQGIPARLASGYAAGEFIDDANVYRVRAKDAHTWVEVYFPTYGWIQFEPTSAIPVYTRPEDNFSGPSGDDGGPTPFDELPPEDELNRGDLLPEENFEDPGAAAVEDLPQASGVSWLELLTVQNLRRVGAVLVVILSGIAVWLASILNRRVEEDVTQSYERLGRWGEWVGFEVVPSQTPYERAEGLGQAVPQGQQPIQRLTDQFVTYSYSDNLESADIDPQREWRLLRPIMIRETIARYLRQRWKSIRFYFRRFRF